MYDEKKDILAHCRKCNKIMIVKDYKIETSSDIYVKSLGYKASGRIWCLMCFYKKTNYV